MASNRGKLFEREFRRGLNKLPGMAVRLYDGTNVARVQMPGDFIYAACSGKTALIECKSTQERSLPYANFQAHQMPDLLHWCETGNGNRASLVAVEYWRHGVAFLIGAVDLSCEMAASGRKSLPVDRAAEIGRQIPRIKGEDGFYYTLGVLETGAI